MTKWISEREASGLKYHTDRDCDYLPENHIPLSEVDERYLHRYTKCRECAGVTLADELEALGHD